MDISCVIPCSGEREMLWATVASARADLENGGMEFEIIAVMDGCAPDIATYMLEQGTAKIIYTDVGSPQGARHVGALQATGELLVFADAHVIFPSGFFMRLRFDMLRERADLMHTPNRFLARKFQGFTVDWGGYLWSAQRVPEPKNGPFKIALAGHGAFGIWRDSYFRAGGYWQALKGFGGEETQLNFKLWMMGMSCWMSPANYHWHWMPPQGRRGPEMFAERNFARNFLMVAAAYGDEEQVRQSHLAMMLQHWGFEDKYPGLIEEVLSDPDVASERDFMQEHAVYRSLADLKAMFDAQGVVN